MIGLSKWNKSLNNDCTKGKVAWCVQCQLPYETTKNLIKNNAVGYGVNLLSGIVKFTKILRLAETTLRTFLTDI